MQQPSSRGEVVNIGSHNNDLMDQAGVFSTSSRFFHAKRPLVPFLVWCIYGSTLPSLFFGLRFHSVNALVEVKLGADIKVASRIGP